MKDGEFLGQLNECSEEEICAMKSVIGKQGSEMLLRHDVCIKFHGTLPRAFQGVGTWWQHKRLSSYRLKAITRSCNSENLNNSQSLSSLS
jgi:hypothetical protein